MLRPEHDVKLLRSCELPTKLTRKEILMKEFLRVLVEESAIGLGQGDPMTWFWWGFFTLLSMRLANKLGKFIANR